MGVTAATQTDVRTELSMGLGQVCSAITPALQVTAPSYHGSNAATTLG